MKKSATFDFDGVEFDVENEDHIMSSDEESRRVGVPKKKKSLTRS